MTVRDMAARTIPLHAPYLDRVNQRTWTRPHVLRQFEYASGWLEPGERLSIERVADAVRNEPILDIGVGGGRSAPLLAELSSNYRGIDYLPDMVRIARRRFPTLCFLEMDARRLSFIDQTFRLVSFTYNGIDAVDLDGRLQILREVQRVLLPGGYFVFSALNRRGSAYGERWPDFSVFRAAGASPARQARAIARFAIGGWNWLRSLSLRHNASDAAIGTLSAHNFGLVTMFTSVSEQVRELSDCGLIVQAVIDPDGADVPQERCDASVAPWHYFVA